MEFNPTYADVENEDCSLHYWYQGKGPLIVFVPGSDGHGRQFKHMLALLSDSYTCATFDRRQMTNSPAKVNKIFNPPQQARDIIAIIKAIGFEKAIIFGSSLGGILGFQLAVDHPEAVEHLIAHEAPTANLLPNYSTLFEWFINGPIETAKKAGPFAAWAEFGSAITGVDDKESPAVEVEMMTEENAKNFWENEALVGLAYAPNLRWIVENETSVAVMVGAKSGDGMIPTAVLEQERILGCLRVVAPGNHQEFETESKVFAPILRKLIDDLEKKKAEKHGK